MNLEDSDSVLESLETTVLKEKILAVMEINETGVGDRFVEKTSLPSNEQKKKEHLIIYFLLRSIRETKRSWYLDDYILLAEVESERLLLLVNDEPWNYDEKKGEKVWRDACQDEITSIMKNKTWDLVDLPSVAKAIGLMWVFNVKRNSDGSINKYKARLVAKGYIQRHGVDYEECSSSSNRVFVSLWH